MIKIDPRNKTIAEHYGLERQLNKLIEEMAELTVAIMHLNKPDDARKRQIDVIEELGDVSILVDQVQYLLSVPDKVNLAESISYKLNRELVRIGAIKESKYG